MTYNNIFFRFYGWYSDRPGPPLGAMPRGEVAVQARSFNRDTWSRLAHMKRSTATLRGMERSREQGWIDKRTQTETNG
jgi:hypothetical protein